VRAAVKPRAFIADLRSPVKNLWSARGSLCAYYCILVFQAVCQWKPPYYIKRTLSRY